MASVINSARTSTASVFGVIGTLAETAGQSLVSVNLALESLNAKAREMRDNTVETIEVTRAVNQRLAIQRHAADYLDEAEQLHARLFGPSKFNRNDEALKALEFVSEAVAKAHA